MTVQIHQGDCRALLAAMPAGIFHSCVTSPPYWGLRDYGTEPLDWPAFEYAPMPGLPACVSIPAMRCSLGLEPTVEAFIGHIVLVFRAVYRVLRDDATCWINMGDCYATSGSKVNTQPGRKDHGRPETNGRGEPQSAVGSRVGAHLQPNRMPQQGLKPKDLVGQPFRVAFALQADGWYWRQDIVWHKPNPMPESTKDRLTKAHEYFMLMTKQRRYYFDHEAIKEEASPDTHARYARGRSATHKHDARASLVPGQPQQTIARSFDHMRKPVAGWATGEGDHSTIAHAQVGAAT